MRDLTVTIPQNCAVIVWAKLNEAALSARAPVRESLEKVARDISAAQAEAIRQEIREREIPFGIPMGDILPPIGRGFYANCDPR